MLWIQLGDLTEECAVPALPLPPAVFFWARYPPEALWEACFRYVSLVLSVWQKKGLTVFCTTFLTLRFRRNANSSLYPTPHLSLKWFRIPDRRKRLQFMKPFKLRMILLPLKEGIKGVGIQNSILPPKSKLSLSLLFLAPSLQVLPFKLKTRPN